MVKKNSDFDHFVEELKFAYTLFCFSVKLDEKFAEKKYVDKKDLVLFWHTHRVNLKRSYLSELAKIFEKPSTRFDEVLPIYWLLDFEFKDHEKTIDSLKKLRNKFLMHNDLETRREQRLL